jgi:hypothetical protein
MAPPLAGSSLVLHALRLTGMTGGGRLAGATGLGDAEVRAALDELAAVGHVEHHQGTFGGWAATPLGTQADDAALAAELEATRSQASVEQAYRSFLALNPELLSACTDWQLVVDDAGVHRANDHTDEAYDASVVARLVDIDRRAQPVLASLTTSLARFEPYRRRLRLALDHVRSGESDWFTGPLFDSYHTVWFELHQDLLHTLGLDRGSEHGERGAS